MTQDKWHTNEVLVRLPAHLRQVPYVGERFPGSPAVTANPDIVMGANCQLFAYAILEHFGRTLPPLRSSELWLDRCNTIRVSTAAPLDLLLFNGTSDPWGAHVGVSIGEDQIVHLCAEIGRPVVWSMGEFATRDRYRVLVGIKSSIRP